MLAEVITEVDGQEGSFETGSGGAGQGYNPLGVAGAGGGGGPAGAQYRYLGGGQEGTRPSAGVQKEKNGLDGVCLAWQAWGRRAARSLLVPRVVEGCKLAC